MTSVQDFVWLKNKPFGGTIKLKSKARGKKTLNLLGKLPDAVTASISAKTVWEVSSQ